MIQTACKIVPVKPFSTAEIITFVGAPMITKLLFLRQPYKENCPQRKLSTFGYIHWKNYVEETSGSDALCGMELVMSYKRSPSW